MSSDQEESDISFEAEDQEQAENCIEVPTLLEPVGYGSSSCGYCSPPGERTSGNTSKSYGMIASQMSPRIYQKLIDRGWRRSGDYVYHPDNANTCCPQLTIRLDAMAFKPEKDKKLRHVMNRWKRFVMEGNGKESEAGPSWSGLREGPPSKLSEKIPEEGPSPSVSDTTPVKPPRITEALEPKQLHKRPRNGSDAIPQNVRKRQKPSAGTFDFLKELHAPEFENAGNESAHRFEIRLVKAKATPETFQLYDKYQQSVHGDRPGKNTMTSFRRFLCSHPLGWQKIDYGRKVPGNLPTHFGAYHQLYMMDGKLIAFSVIDILPGCVSSVYFVWDPDYAWASLGKLSALREAALAREMQDAGLKGAGWLYMGFYIHSCSKMKYKGEYSPSQLLDSGTNVFHPLDEVVPILNSHPTGYRPFSAVADGSEIRQSSELAQRKMTTGREVSWPTPSPPGFQNPKSIDKEILRNLVVFLQGKLVLLRSVPFRKPTQGLELATQLLAAVGEDLIATTKSLDRNVFMAL